MNKIEEVAREIERANGNREISTLPFGKEARAAIEAMRTLTPEMGLAVAIAGCQDWCRERDRCGQTTVRGEIRPECLARARRSHNAAIDAALKGDA